MTIRKNILRDVKYLLYKMKEMELSCFGEKIDYSFVRVLYILCYWFFSGDLCRKCLVCGLSLTSLSRLNFNVVAFIGLFLYDFYHF